MGIDGFDIVITGYIGNADNDVTANSVTKLSKWLQDGNTTTLFLSLISANSKTDDLGPPL